jgi:hypothetical protein
MIFYSIVLFMVPVLIYTVMVLVSEDAFVSLSFYIKDRLFQRITEDPSTDSRWFLISNMSQNLLISITLCGVILIVGRLKAGKLKMPSRLMILFLLIGASASLPMLLTRVQNGFYTLPAIPFFAIAMALAAGMYVEKALDWLQSRTRILKGITIFSIFSLAGVFVFTAMQLGKASRNEDILHDVYKIGPLLSEGEVMGIDSEIYDQWNTQCYFIRYYGISLDPRSDRSHEYYLREKNRIENPDGYEKVALGTLRYDLYRKKPKAP